MQPIWRALFLHDPRNDAVIGIPKHYHPCRWRCEKCEIEYMLEDVRKPVIMMNHSCGGRLIATQWAEPEPA